MKIRAYAVKRQGGMAEPFFYERKVRKSDVLVKVTHCGIATGDIQIINNDWGDTKFPLVPGHEMIGIIEKTGLEVTGLKNGDRVGIGYQQEACFECEFCKEGHFLFSFHAGNKIVHFDKAGDIEVILIYTFFKQTR